MIVWLWLLQIIKHHNTIVQSKHSKNKEIVIQTRYIHCAVQRLKFAFARQEAVIKCCWHEILTAVVGLFVACFFSFGTTRSDGGLSPYPSLDTQHSLPGTQRSLEVKYASQYCVSLASTHTPGHAMFPEKLRGWTRVTASTVAPYTVQLRIYSIRSASSLN